MDPNPLSVPSSEELLEHLGFVRGLAAALVRDLDVAEDLTQEAMIVALEQPPRLKKGLRQWLSGVVRNLARSHYRGERRRSLREQAAARHFELNSGQDTAQEALQRAELRRRIVDEVLHLREPYRTTFVLRYLEELPPATIAKKQEISVETVNTRLQRGLAQLRGKLDAEYRGNRRAWVLLLLPLGELQPSVGALGSKEAGKVPALRLWGVAAISLVVVGVASLMLSHGWPSGFDSSSSASMTRHAEDNAATAVLDDANADVGNSASTADQLVQSEAFATLPSVAAVVPEPPEARIRLRVLDAESGWPVPEAEVFLVRSGDRVNSQILGRLPMPGWLPNAADYPIVRFSELRELAANPALQQVSLPLHRTKGNGVTELPGVAFPLVLVVTHEQQAPTLGVFESAGPDGLELTMARGGTIEISGPRVASGVVACRVGTMPEGSPVAFRNLDSNGEAAVGSLLPGQYTMTVLELAEEQIASRQADGCRVSMDGGHPRSLRTLEVEVRAGSTTRVDLSNVDQHAIEVTLLGDPSDDEFSVSLWSLDRRVLYGEFGSRVGDTKRFEGLKVGRYLVLARGLRGAQMQQEVELTRDRTSEVHLRIPRTRIVGRVVDERNEPLLDAFVVLAPKVEEIQVEPTSAPPLKVDDEGRFRLDGALAGDYVLLAAHAGSLCKVPLTLTTHDSRELIVTLAQGELTTVEVRLEVPGEEEASPDANKPLASPPAFIDETGLVAWYLITMTRPPHELAGAVSYRLPDGDYRFGSLGRDGVGTWGEPVRLRHRAESRRTVLAARPR